MKKRKLTRGLAKTLLCFGAISAGLFSCDSDRLNENGGSGRLRISLSADTTSLKKGVTSSTRSVSVDDEFFPFLTTGDYKIRIVQDKDTVSSFDRFDEMPSEIKLKEGAYTLVAYKGNNLPAAFENPYFEGNADFTIKADMNTPIDITCTLGNARIMADYTEDFKKMYSDYATLLKTSFTTNNLEIVKGEQRPAYLQIDKEGTELSISIRVKKVGEEKEKTYTVPSTILIERRQNVRLIFKTDGSTNGIGLDVLLDDKLEEKTYWPEIPDFMLPKN
ncbi:DUF4493 domain-containing protein [Parabacteroides bouchesdurhonensis]|uniref:DUF4493 domain-containing protein n=1 Tax=Parabacteroides bouchesdurhonensis TaxID=1936995 RepID=UPI000E498EFA|nr:DUF4493 domain-containing protein [Parabacteroides bouchesdurhonensis]RHJ94156.1 DUF4493 domain-containing protein [Bacteroides sp. AM07-16]